MYALGRIRSTFLEEPLFPFEMEAVKITGSKGIYDILIAS